MLFCLADGENHCRFATVSLREVQSKIFINRLKQLIMAQSNTETCCLQVRKLEGLTNEMVKDKPRWPLRDAEELTTQGQTTLTTEQINTNRPILVLLKGFPPFYYNSIDDCLEDYPYYLEALCVEDPGDQQLEFGYYDESDETSRSVKENSHLIYIKFRMTANGPKDPLVEGVCRSFKELIELREKCGLGMFLHYNCIDSAPFK